MTPTPPIVSRVLADYGARTREALARHLPEASTGKLEQLMRDYPGRGGKMMRPSLLIATARAFGADSNEALAAAVAVEMLHNGTLIHDDIEDESETRRGRPTLHVEHGMPMALWAGNALVLRSLRPITDLCARLDPRLAFQLLAETERMSRESAEGQALELGWRRDNAFHLEPADYFEMVLKKTCWLAFIYPFRIGALIGGRGHVDLESFIRLGFFLGTAFQIQDDLLNLIGEEEKYGKELAGDLKEGKRTLMLIHLSRHATAGERARLARILGRPRPQRHDDDIAWILERMGHYGSFDHAAKIARGLADAALYECDRILHTLRPSRDRQFIQELIPWVLSRAA